jgi:hypothetical protein
VGIATESYFLLQRDNMAIQGEEPFEEDLDWLKYGREMIQESPNILDEAAKSFLTLASTFLTVYTGALALFKFNERSHDLLSWLAICTPIILWLLCISSMAYVHFPDRLKFRKNRPSDIERVTMEVSRKKSFRLKVGLVLFVAALAATSISIVWLGAQGPSQSQKDQTVQFVVLMDKNTSSRNVSITFGGIERTTSPALLEKGNKTCLVWDFWEAK